MKRILSPAICAGVLLLSGVSVEAIMSPAFAQTDEGIDFQTIRDTLAPYGDWVYSDRWGLVWTPEDVPSDFRPYDSDGYWANTDYGWYWVSQYEWGDIPFHYGRWVNDPDDGWLWIPGYVWSPGWVVWRSSGRYVGWMPMPPDRTFLAGGNVSFGLPGFGLSFSFGDDYGYRRWYGRDYDDRRFASNWVFVDQGHMADRDFRRHLAPHGNYAQFIRGGRDITHYSVNNNYVTNRGIDPKLVQRAGGRPVPVMHLNQVAKHRQFVTTANQGQQTQMRMRQTIPHGTGAANSAPQPSQNVVQSLSNKVNRNGGRSGAHLFTRDTITNAPLKGGARGQVGQPNLSQPGGNQFQQQNGPNNAGPQTGPAPSTPQELTRHREHAPPPNGPNGPNGGPLSTPTNPNVTTPQTGAGSGGQGTPQEFTRHREHAPPPNAPANGPANVTPNQNVAPTPTNPNGPANTTPFSERHQHTTPTGPNTSPQTETPSGNGPQGGPGGPQGGPNGQGNPERFRHQQTNPGGPNGPGPQGSGQGPAGGPAGGPPGGPSGQRMHTPPPNAQGTPPQGQENQPSGKQQKQKHDENPPDQNPH